MTSKTTAAKRSSMISGGWYSGGWVSSGSPFSMCGWRAARSSRWSAILCSRLSWKVGHQAGRAATQGSWHGSLPPRIGDGGFLRDIERAMGREEETVAKRRTAMAAQADGGSVMCRSGESGLTSHLHPQLQPAQVERWCCRSCRTWILWQILWRRLTGLRLATKLRFVGLLLWGPGGHDKGEDPVNRNALEGGTDHEKKPTPKPIVGDEAIVLSCRGRISRRLGVWFERFRGHSG